MVASADHFVIAGDGKWGRDAEKGQSEFGSMRRDLKSLNAPALSTHW
jgi:hypothetical protein